MNQRYLRIGVAVALLLALCAVLTPLKLRRVTDMGGDSALFFQTTENIARTGAPVSRVYQHMFFYHLKHYAKFSAERLAGESLIEPSGNDNVLHLHTYFVLLPLGLLARFAPVEPELISVFVLSFVGLLGLAALYFERRGVPLAFGALFLLVVALHPAWGEPLLLGQFYPDRIFVFAGAALMFIGASPRMGRLPLLLAALLCVSVNERGALVGGVALALYAALHWKSTPDRLFKLLLGCGMFVFGIAMLKFVITSGMYDTYVGRSLHELLFSLTAPQSLWETTVFVAVNGVLLAFAVFDLRCALIALVAMLPQLMGTEGMTDKLDWVAHYHSFYFPILVWAAARGFVQLLGFARERGLSRFMLPGAVAVLAYALTIEPNVVPLNYSLSQTGQTLAPRLVAELTDAFGPDAQEGKKISQRLLRLIPPDTSVTAPEAAMPFLWRYHDVYKFPAELGHTDYAIVYVDNLTATPVQYDAFGFGTAGARVTTVLMGRLRRAGFDVDHPAFIPALKLAVIARRRAGS